MQHVPTYILDFDSTIISCESLDELARLALAQTPDQQVIVQKLEAITTAAMAGTLSFDTSLQQRLQLFQATKADVMQLTTYLQNCITPSLLARVDWLAQHKEHIYVLSGGFEEYILPIITSLGLLPEHTYANRFIYDTAGRITGYDAARHTAQASGKVAQVRALKLPHPLIVIGDGYTDYEIKGQGEADQFWAFVEHMKRPEVTTRADRILYSFTDLPKLAASLAVPHSKIPVILQTS